jgi:very-short-patch-repair endonuclease
MAQTKPAKTDLTRSLDVARRDLLDLGLRNPLLNYKLLRGKGLDVVDEKPVELFRILVREEKRMSFLPGESSPQSSNRASDQLAQPETDTGTPSRHTDLRIQTEYSSQQLQSRLLATYRTARTSIEEQGVNTLYLALGIVTWREDDKSEKFYRAPLILIPVTLERSDALARFHLTYSGEEIGENISLAEKLKQEFGVKEFPRLPEADDIDVAAYFRAVESVIRRHSGWSVETDAVALGFFSFAKFLMYRDLDPTTWPAAEGVLEHRILQSLFGSADFLSSSPTYQDNQLLDNQHPDGKLVQVVDADSSQTIALLEAMGGHNLVIQGPPGTGKSQTIVNLIAAAIAEGKKVLFVSEKMAALDVVKRRLDKLGLDGPCLELHSNRTNKKSIIDELKRTVGYRASAAPNLLSELALLADSRNKLNDYCSAVNEQIANSGESPRSAFGKRLDSESAIQGVEAPSLRLDAAANWTAVDSVRRALLVQQVQDRLAASGVPCRHPFWGTRLTMLLPTEKEEIRGVIRCARAAADDLEGASSTLSTWFSVPAPSTPADAAWLWESAKYVSNAPDLTGIDTELPEWLAREGEIREILRRGKLYRDIRQQYDSILRPDAWTRDTTSIRQELAHFGEKWWRFVSGRWRRAKRELAGMCHGIPPSSRSEQLSLLDAIAHASEATARIAAAQDWMTRLFPSGWVGVHSDWDLLESQALWAIGARRGIQQGALMPWCANPAIASLDRVDARRRVQGFEASQKAYQAAIHSCIQKLQIDESRFDRPLSLQPFSALIARWDAQDSGIDDLHGLVTLNQLTAQCEAESLQAIVRNWDQAARYLFSVYERARLAALLDRAFRERPSLAAFDGQSHSQVVDHFRRLDLLQLKYDGALLAARHADSVPKAGGNGAIGVLWREFEKRRKFLPIRTLIMNAGNAIQAIKPVFMMSPISIANYLPPGALNFDLVIFDEASQVRPVDALGAIARGKQIVVVGDRKQMPPTSFFDSLTGPEDADEEEDAVATSDIESILGLFCAQGARQRMLRWHYRSRHDSLITVSNHLFYDDQLVVFPSPARDRKTLGLVYRHLADAPYDRGRTRTNPGEAKTVAATVMAHARAQLRLPQEDRETLGVGAFSIAQMTAILDQLELLRRQDPSCEEFFSHPPHEPFFVKNLENLQGDERDVIFISVGYGRTAEGFLSASFGPLNRAGGERRLNVLISRARKRCEVFTNLRADDIDLSKTSSAGAAALKTFLKYAETGQLDVPAQTDRPPDSEFEEHVLRRLTALGHDVHAQVGSAGFFLDLAVVDPANPGRYLLGIECDGASYHSARSARDRDRLRQAVLEGLGWRIHRIWSTDWFRNPEQELAKVVQAIQSARNADPKTQIQAPPSRPAETEPPALTLHEQPANPLHKLSSLPRYECANVSLRLGNVEMHLVDRSQLADFIAGVVSVESPVHRVEAARRVLNGAGVQRFGTRIQQAFEEAVLVGLERKLFMLRGEFLWRPAMQESPLRDRSQLPAASRKFEFVAPEEIRRAILTVVEESYGIAPPEVPNAVCRLLGFTRASEDMTAAIEQRREDLLREGCLALQGVNLMPLTPATGLLM